MGWEIVIVVLISAVMHAAWNSLVKSGTDRHLDTVVVVTGAALVTLALVPFLPAPARDSWPYLAGSALVHVGYFVLVARAYRIGDLSLVYPIMRGAAPAFTALVSGMLMNEPLSSVGWVGVVLVSGGALLLSLESRRNSGAAVTLALGNADVVVVYTTPDGIGSRLSPGSSSVTRPGCCCSPPACS